MNYRHEFHAGNFADVFKHLVLSRVLLYLCLKPAPFRYLDTHAGSGLYDLSREEAAKTQEWRTGIGRLLKAAAPPKVKEIIGPYVRIAAPHIGEVAPHYPGSPWIAKALLRPQDKMLLCELHPRAFADLKAVFRSETRTKLFEMDGYMGLCAFVPPVERRGLALIDPPFEQPDEFERAFRAIKKAWRKWATGIYMLWYPVKDPAAAEALARAFAKDGLKRVLRLELQVDAPEPERPLSRCGIIIVNPPYRRGCEKAVKRQLRPRRCQCLLRPSKSAKRKRACGLTAGSSGACQRLPSRIFIRSCALGWSGLMAHGPKRRCGL